MTQHSPRIKNNSLPSEPAGMVRNPTSKARSSRLPWLQPDAATFAVVEELAGVVGMISADWWRQCGQASTDSIRIGGSFVRQGRLDSVSDRVNLEWLPNRRRPWQLPC
jgi:hypothetical protein